MNTTEAEGCVLTLQAAFARELPPETISLYVQLFESYPAQDAQATVDRLLRICRRMPVIADIHEAFAVIGEQRAERLRQGRALALPEGRPDERATQRGIRHIRSVLVSMGVLPRPKHDGDGLTVAERRHGFHVKQSSPQPDICRFCRESVEAP